MASELSEILSEPRSKNDEVQLEEIDIPGAVLLKPPEQCTIVILKRWLACRGAKVSGKRGALIQRVNDYINNGLASHVIDPDGGINLQRKRLNLGVDEEVNPLTDESFPTDGYRVGVADCPKIGYPQIWKYLIEEVELKKQLSVEKPIVKGYNFFKSGKVLGVFSCSENNLHYVKSQVMPSYSKSGPVYCVKMIIKANSYIHKAYCPCPAGVDGRCNHLAATLFAIEDMCGKADSMDSRNTNELPCTSKPCVWSVPKKRLSEPTPINAVKFAKHVWGKKREDTLHSMNAEYDVRAPHQRQQDQDLEKVKELEEKHGKLMGLSFILPHSLPEKEAVPEPEEETGGKAAPTSKWNLVSPIKNGPLSLNDISDKALRAKERLYKSAEDVQDIAHKTLQQHESRAWYDVRQPRITASKCKRCVLKPTTSPTKAISEVLLYNAPVQTQAMKEGIELEPKIILQFEIETGHTVEKSGFLLSESKPYLGASPDGITEEGNLVEVIKITVKDDETLDDAMCRKGIYKRVGTELVINKNHQYFYQIQQQLYCSKRTVCHFIVSDGYQMHTESVAFDSAFWGETLPKLKQFYFDSIFPELVYPRILHGATRWNKDIPFPIRD